MRGLLINKARSFLALLGIIIGIGAVITITALAEGLRVAAEQQIDDMGTNLVFVVPQMSQNDQRSQAGRRGYHSPSMFSDREIRAIDAGLTVPAVISASVQQEANVVYGRDTQFISVAGVDENYFDNFNFEVVDGRPFTPGEISGARRVTILGHQTAEDFFDDDDPIGQTVEINGNRFEVIGILKEIGGGLGENPDKVVLVPLRVAQTTLFGMGDEVFFLIIKVQNMNDVEVLKDDVTRAMNRIRRIDDPDDENYAAISQTDALEGFGQFINVLTMVLGGVAAVSLLVGGIGIMNIMLVTVTERTREIGLRKAVGARQVDVLFQFLIEAIVLCLVGGLVGMGVGYLGAMGLSALINSALPDVSWNPVISVTSVIVAVVFSTMIGVIFGVYPAANAARKDPISALRYE